MIRVGSIASSVKDEVSDFQPLVAYLVAQLKGKGIDGGRVVVAQSIQEMVDLVTKEEVDIYVDSAFPVLSVSRLAGMTPLLRRWKRGRSEYHTVIFVREDSGLESVSDLGGRMMAFDEPSSTSGYMIPKAVLSRSGLVLRKFESPSAHVSPDTVGYVFSMDDENTIFWVLEKMTSAGAMDDGSFAAMSGERIDELKVLKRSTSVPRQLVAFRNSMDSTLMFEIEHILLEMDESEEGRNSLRRFQETKKFDTFHAGADEGLTSLMEFITK